MVSETAYCRDQPTLHEETHRGMDPVYVALKAEPEAILGDFPLGRTGERAQ